MMRRIFVENGTKFGRLVTVCEAEPYIFRARTFRQFLVRCVCGAELTVRFDMLRSGRTRSCGCLQSEVNIARSTKHGENQRGRRTAEYTTWAQMIQRCTNPKRPKYADYGARGIKVCEEWIASYDTFLSDMVQAIC